ncbi:two pore domain potassium channel family protein, partial [Candidatus Bipolaricaulota bacterium]|nr:two pore domain potassium channel family protein [Candidatus Bipolaricaulota bacterium]
IEGDARFAGATIEGDASFDGLICRSLWHGPNMPRIRGWRDRRCGAFIIRPEAAVSYWRFAQRVFSKTGEREKADAAFYFERLNRWRILRRTKAHDRETWGRRLWRNWVIRPEYWVLFLLDLLFVRWTTAYGASVARLFFTWFAVIGGFGITFSMVPRLIERADVYRWSLENWIIGMHYSVTTFATLGLGRINPGGSRLGMVLTSIEAILGAVLIALAVLVIGRRFMRQG